MSHSTSVVKLGNSLSSAKMITDHDGDPATYLAGLVVRQGSSALSLLKSAGFTLGVSMGRSLSDHKKTAILRAGELVPVRAHLKRSSGTVTITNIANLVSGTDDTITIGATAFTATDGAVTPGQATFDARTGTTEAAASLAAQINAHATAGALVYAVANSAVVTLYAKVEGAGTGHDVATSYEQLGTGTGATVEQAALAGGSNTLSAIDYIAVGAKMYVNDTTGKADVAMTGFSTVTDAVYRTIEMTGLDEDLAETPAVLVDMPGGL